MYVVRCLSLYLCVLLTLLVRLLAMNGVVAGPNMYSHKARRPRLRCVAQAVVRHRYSTCALSVRFDLQLRCMNQTRASEVLLMHANAWHDATSNSHLWLQLQYLSSQGMFKLFYLADLASAECNMH